jgi:hypothetical protein
MLAWWGGDCRLQQSLGDAFVRYNLVAAGQEQLGQPQEPNGHKLGRPELLPVAANEGRTHDGQGGEPDATVRLHHLAFAQVVEEARARVGACRGVQRKGTCTMLPGEPHHGRQHGHDRPDGPPRGIRRQALEVDQRIVGLRRISGRP